MKNNIKLLSLLIIALISFNSCDQEDDLVFTAQEPTDGISFSNSFLDEYVLTVAASKNLGERFTWNNANFGVPTNVSYELENSMLGDFTDATTVSTTSGNELAITIGQMLGFAEAAGLDNDPETDNPNTGDLYFRIKASVGTDGGLPTYSSIQALTVVIPEIVVGGGGGAFEPSIWGLVGSAANDWGGAGPDLPFYTTSDPDIVVAYANLKDGEIKFRQENNWDLTNYGDATGDGIADTENDNNITVTAGDYKIEFNTATLAYTIEPFSYGIVGSAWNDWGGAGPDAKFFYDYTTDTFKVGVKLQEGQMKIRFNQDWDLPNYGDATGDGILDTDSDNNINVTAGYYLVTININDFSYSIVEASLWGIVGSGYNDWGSGGPDFMFTPITETQWLAQNVTLVNGEIKIRENENWDLPNYGDATDDGVLDMDNDNNIMVTAGVYDIKLDFTNPDAPTYVFITK